MVYIQVMKCFVRNIMRLKSCLKKRVFLVLVQGIGFLILPGMVFYSKEVLSLPPDEKETIVVFLKKI